MVFSKIKPPQTSFSRNTILLYMCTERDGGETRQEEVKGGFPRMRALL